MKLYHSYHLKRKKEHEFLKFILELYPNIELIRRNFRLNEVNLNSSVEIIPIVESLKLDNYLPAKKKQFCIDILMNLNLERVSVFESVNKISIDFVIDIGFAIYFIELHENQHKKLSGNRPSKIHDLKGNEVIVPRYLQRLLKDIWRSQNLNNYQIIWSDWFEEPSSRITNLLVTGRKEFGIVNTFKFKNLGV